MIDPFGGSGTTTFAVNGCAFRDPAFKANRDAPVHRWVPWIAGYSHSRVVGTTLVEADLC